MILPVVKIALRALPRNKVRSALTMLGIIIGVASVIAMVSLGQGAQKQVQQAVGVVEPDQVDHSRQQRRQDRDEEAGRILG